MPGDNYTGNSPTLSKDELNLREKLKNHVRFLSEKIGERNLNKLDSLSASSQYIKSRWQNHKLDVEKQWYKVNGIKVHNLFTFQPGLESKAIIIGAHYDSALNTPGANDNASGVACLIELALELRKYKLKSSIYWVAFVNEEPPWFKTKQMGSYRFAQKLSTEHQEVIAMYSLETLGYYSQQPNSQKYPRPLSWFYPDKANFITFVANRNSKKLLFYTMKQFRKKAMVPSEGIAASSFFTGIDWSDHWSFWEFEYPALMITDTALFRYQHYHQPSDTWQRLNYDRLAQVVSALAFTIKSLAQGSLK